MFDMPFDTLELKAHPGRRIPIHPQPGIFETTITEDEIGPDWYLKSRSRVFGDTRAMNDVITDRMLDDGWEPSEHGCLVKRGKPKKKSAKARPKGSQ